MVMGRPKLPAKERQNVILGVRLTKAEKRAFEKAAEKTGVSLSTHIRKLLGLKKESAE
jgi:hypothetical protein